MDFVQRTISFLLQAVLQAELMWFKTVNQLHVIDIRQWERDVCIKPLIQVNGTVKISNLVHLPSFTSKSKGLIGRRLQI